MIRLLLICAFSFSATALADDKRETAPAPRKAIDLTGYKTVKEAIKAEAKSFPAGGAPAKLGYLGVALAEKDGKVVIEDVEAGSPAEEAGIKSGDVLAECDGSAPATVGAARERLRGKFAGDVLKMIVNREATAIPFSITLKPLSKPMGSLDNPRVILGIQVARARGGNGIEVTSITGGGGADKAGVKVGDVILKVNETAVDSDLSLREALSDKKAGDTVKLAVQREKQDLDIKATLAAESARGGNPGWDDRLPTNFRKPVYKLAVIGVEYPDTKHEEKITAKHWEDALFSDGSYTGKSATGQDVYGSVADYYKELSYGKLKVEGKFIGWIEVGKKKMEYNLGSSTSSNDKSKFFNEMMDKLIAKHGKEALKGYDGVFVVFAGDRVQTSRGGLYWPHRASFTHDRQRYNYFIVPEQSRGGRGGRGGGSGEGGEPRMTDISVICHEFGHMLGLPDLYARPENPGSEGVGVWCAMSNQNGGGRPQHFSAWSKEQMGWIKPTLIDPRVKQKLILNPIEDAGECLKVPARSDGSEYFLLENRQKKGWDKSLPAEGLLIWRVIPPASGGSRGTQQVYLEEAHGVEGPSGPRVYSGAVPFPSPANHSFTPFTTPSSKSSLGGGIDVNITNIRRLPDGRVSFHIGYDYQ